MADTMVFVTSACFSSSAINPPMTVVETAETPPIANAAIKLSAIYQNLFVTRKTFFPKFKDLKL